MTFWSLKFYFFEFFLIDTAKTPHSEFSRERKIFLIREFFTLRSFEGTEAMQSENIENRKNLNYAISRWETSWKPRIQQGKSRQRHPQQLPDEIYLRKKWKNVNKKSPLRVMFSLFQGKLRKQLMISAASLALITRYCCCQSCFHNWIIPKDDGFSLQNRCSWTDLESQIKRKFIP